jgi:hypothetical protein
MSFWVLSEKYAHNCQDIYIYWIGSLIISSENKLVSNKDSQNLSWYSWSHSTKHVLRTVSMTSKTYAVVVSQQYIQNARACTYIGAMFVKAVLKKLRECSWNPRLNAHACRYDHSQQRRALSNVKKGYLREREPIIWEEEYL